ncbi:bzip transcription factor [Lasallia pustulata]|uniref:Bzip transcription factor n=1 Tax=Lasallia pustulata TaxID=136370 RepID=A0A1W5CWK4_9LECA|nr:bzip transcription factor [Lasallia pustulata]
MSIFVDGATSASTASPQPLAPTTTPSTNNKRIAPLPSVLETPSILTNRKWVIPPLPKPGRKPATDTPPTKRKAQNRAAQRAFRQRRAAKVGELEEQMKIIEQEDKQEQDQLKSEIERLQAEVEKYRGELFAWRDRCQRLEKELELKRGTGQASEAQLKLLRAEQPVSTEAVPLPSQTSTSDKPGIAQGTQSSQMQGQLPTEEVAIGCGKCSTNSRCECIEQAFNFEIMSADISSIVLKRPHSPSGSTGTKRRRQAPSSIITTDRDADMEIDFTTKPASQPDIGTSTSVQASGLENLVADPCGFCSNGTPCICAEMTFGPPTGRETRTAPTLMQCTPPPSDGDVIHPDPQASAGSINATSGFSSSNPCINGPGTCAQCQADPHSTLFCKSLASASRSALASTMNAQDKAGSAGPCCGTPGACPAVSESRDETSPGVTANADAAQPTVTCADAFTALSRHPAYERASGQLGEWLPQLQTIANHSRGMENRTAYEIESASVLGVLRFFDRRFGK